MTMTEKKVYKGRFGFHACDYDTYCKLKKLHAYYWKALRRYAEWERWNRKDPSNRLLRKWFRNEKGQKTGFEIVGPKPEPVQYPVFIDANYYKIKGTHRLKSESVLEDYQKARTPYATEEAVQPLTLSVDKINKMLALLEAFEAAN